MFQQVAGCPGTAAASKRAQQSVKVDVRLSGLILVVFRPMVSRESVCAAEIQVGPSEKQRAHHWLLHAADPGGTQVPARQPDSTPRHQGDDKESLCSQIFCGFNHQWFHASLFFRKKKNGRA